MQLALDAVTAARGDRVLFRDISLSLKRGEALRVRGANGSGKTTLLRLLCGLGSPVAGAVRWGGNSVQSVRDEFHRALLYVGHAAGVKDDLLAWENVAASSALAGRPCTRAQAIVALEAIGLAQQAWLPARVLSQGQRRRVALARLYLDGLPELLVLDEPFSALDQDAIGRLCARLRRHLEGAGMLVYTTHQEVPLETARALDLDAAC
ncbi:MAG: cytochrome c biogenesis heme-transporting ATPase CcmA [Gammaproteobacteria bacterium]